MHNTLSVRVGIGNNADARDAVIEIERVGPEPHAGLTSRVPHYSIIMVRKPMASLFSLLSRSRSVTSPATTRLMLNLNLFHSPDTSYFAALPEEIIIKILEWCDFRGVLACQRVRLFLCPRFMTALIAH